MSFSVSGASQRIGLIIYHSEGEIFIYSPIKQHKQPDVVLICVSIIDELSKTKIIFHPHEQYVVVDRSSVNVNMEDSEDTMELQDINDDPEAAPHTLFTVRELANGVEVQREETLDITVLFDASVLEIFVNSRTVITTRVYPVSAKCFGIRPFAERLPMGNGEPSKVLNCVCWELRPAVTWDV